MDSDSEDAAGVCRDPVGVVVVDDCGAFASATARGLQQLGWSAWTADSFEAAERILESGRAGHVVSELEVGRLAVQQFCSDSRTVTPQRCVVVTAYPSVASAVRLIRMGFAGYLAKPAAALAVHAALIGDPRLSDHDDCASLELPSLDRTIWEYLNQIRQGSGSLSAAARCLRIDRRSLRRMLAKYPPPR